jgi:hypothetical protein
MMQKPVGRSLSLGNKLQNSHRRTNRTGTSNCPIKHAHKDEKRITIIIIII